MMNWILLSPFTHDVEPGWIFAHFCANRHTIRAVPANYLHDRSRRVSSASDWKDYFMHSLRGFMQALNSRNQTGFITVFPQLAIILALLKKLTGRKKFPIIAWCFNLAKPYGGLKGKIARFCLPSVDLFVVHSRAEIDIYSKWLGIDSSRFIFVPLSASVPNSEPWCETQSEPYVLSLGTANRDYELLINAVNQLGYKTIIIAGEHATRDLTLTVNVTRRSNVTLAECHQLAAHARINVIPVSDVSSPSGQVTVIESMMLGVPLVATSCAGTTDYVKHEVDGLLVEAKNVNGMTAAIERLWNDDALRSRLAANARRSAMQNFTFSAVAANMLELMDRFA
jgi:glycosyltransferase involved in cell wall biosynthesis